MIRQFEAGVTLLGGGPWNEADLREALTYTPHLVCADGAANGLVEHAPDLIIGDLDSLNDRAAWHARLGDGLIHVAEQDSTDFEKCLAHISAPFVIGVGFLGGRIDHELATLSAMAAANHGVVLIGDEDVVFAPNITTTFATKPGQRVSVFPMMPLAAGSDGLKWPLDGLALTPGGTIATSNEATGTKVTLHFDTPGALVFLPRTSLEPVLRAIGAIKPE